MRAPRRYGLPLLLAAATVAAAGISGCSSGSASSTGASTSQGPELTHITIGALEIPDAIPAIIAQKEGFFKKQGLTVTIDPIPASEDTTAQLLSHTLTFTVENDVSLFTQDQQTPSLQLHDVADDLQAGPGTFALMVPKSSKITSVSELKGKTIAFPGPGPSIGSLSMDVLLSAYHTPVNDYQNVIVPFPNMPQALAAGKVDAAWTTEPFVTIMEAAGAKELVDLMTGAMNQFPISCWATTGYVIQHDPKTVAAFQRAIVQAQQLAASNQTLVRQLLPGWIKGLPASVANVMALGTFDTTVSLTRLQRVADVLEQYKVLPSNFAVKSFYYPLPSGA
jgi:NitT/TauT family transport system substrate-binding protein